MPLLRLEQAGEAQAEAERVCLAQCTLGGQLDSDLEPNGRPLAPASEQAHDSELPMASGRW